jgi:alkylhydroperoxidase/carboxymuconolactone decarboxylase family protein YurZ
MSVRERTRPFIPHIYCYQNSLEIPKEEYVTFCAASPSIRKTITGKEGGSVMDEKTELLICLAAAVAANCFGCFEYYMKRVGAVGLPDSDIGICIEIACKVKSGANALLRNKIQDLTGERTGRRESDGTCSGSSCCH